LNLSKKGVFVNRLFSFVKKGILYSFCKLF
jgi:hypothetical protein